MPTDSLYGPGFRRRPPYYDRIAHLLPTTPYDALSDDQWQEQLATVASTLTGQLPAESPAWEALMDLVNSLAPAFMPAERPSVYPVNDAVREGQDAGPLRYRVLDDPTRDLVVAVKYNTLNVGHYQTVQPTNREVTVDALLVRHRDGGISRYIDWNFVMAQLGIIGSQRPTLGFADPTTGVTGPRPDTVAFELIDQERLRATDEPDTRPWTRWRRWLRAVMRSR